MKPSDKAEAAEAQGAEPSPAPAKDVVLVHGVTPDGEGLAVLRKREDRVEFGAVHPLKEGQPIHGEVVRLTPRPEFPLVCDVEVQVPAPAQAKSEGKRASETSSRKGPAQVATERYRNNWDAIWNRAPKKPELAN